MLNQQKMREEKREERSPKNARREVRKVSENAKKREERNSKSARTEVEDTSPKNWR